jgi:protein-S-isoprenylcysteine O-methyltransferase Ste14
MSLTSHALKTAIFTLLVPFVVAGVVPQRMVHGVPGASGTLGVIGGGVVTILGIAGYLWCAALFVKAEGTPAPIAPTRRTVVGGLYRINRNPMYTSVLAVVFGQAVLYQSWRVARYGVFLFLAFHLFVLLYEEPTLRRKFNGEYEEFCRRVPRWLPVARLRTDSSLRSQ